MNIDTTETESKMDALNPATSTASVASAASTANTAMTATSSSTSSTNSRASVSASTASNTTTSTTNASNATLTNTNTQVSFPSMGSHSDNMASNDANISNISNISNMSNMSNMSSNTNNATIGNAANAANVANVANRLSSDDKNNFFKTSSPFGMSGDDLSQLPRFRQSSTLSFGSDSNLRMPFDASFGRPRGESGMSGMSAFSSDLGHLAIPNNTHPNPNASTTSAATAGTASTSSHASGATNTNAPEPPHLSEMPPNMDEDLKIQDPNQMPLNKVQLPSSAHVSHVSHVSQQEQATQQLGAHVQQHGQVSQMPNTAANPYAEYVHTAPTSRYNNNPFQESHFLIEDTKLSVPKEKQTEQMQQMQQTQQEPAWQQMIKAELPDDSDMFGDYAKVDSSTGHKRGRNEAGSDSDQENGIFKDPTGRNRQRHSISDTSLLDGVNKNFNNNMNAGLGGMSGMNGMNQMNQMNSMNGMNGMNGMGGFGYDQPPPNKKFRKDFDASGPTQPSIAGHSGGAASGMFADTNGNSAFMTGVQGVQGVQGVAPMPAMQGVSGMQMMFPVVMPNMGSMNAMGTMGTMGTMGSMAPLGGMGMNGMGRMNGMGAMNGMNGMQPMPFESITAEVTDLDNNMHGSAMNAVAPVVGSADFSMTPQTAFMTNQLSGMKLEFDDMTHMGQMGQMGQMGNMGHMGMNGMGMGHMGPDGIEALGAGVNDMPPSVKLEHGNGMNFDMGTGYAPWNNDTMMGLNGMNTMNGMNGMNSMYGNFANGTTQGKVKGRRGRKPGSKNKVKKAKPKAAMNKKKKVVANGEDGEVNEKAEREKVRRAELKDGFVKLTEMLDLKPERSGALLPDRAAIVAAACDEIKKLECELYQLTMSKQNNHSNSNIH